MRDVVLAFTVACGLLASQGSEAAPDTRPASEVSQQPSLARRHTAVHFNGGLFSAVGFGGVTVSHAPVSWALLEGGLGMGMTGVSLSLMPKLALGTASDRFLFGAGLAVSFTGVFDSSTTTPVLLWANVDIAGYEHRFDNGLSLFTALGITVGLAGRLSGDFVNHIAGAVFPQGRLGLGYWF